MAESEATDNASAARDSDATSEGEDHFSDAPEDARPKGPLTTIPPSQPAHSDAADQEDQLNMPSISTPPSGTFAIQDQEDDFDDFEEGAEDEDFGAFDNSSPQEPHHQPAWDDQPVAPYAQTELHNTLPLFDFQGIQSSQDVATATEPYMRELFPAAYKDDLEEVQLAEINRSFLTERSQSLWSQLVAPPPLQPPNWIRSRTRRLFLVSLGVPVDLDEILPASKQKKLVLPSIEIDGDAPQSSAAASSNAKMPKLKQENASATSLGSTPSRSERKRRGLPPPPDLDLNRARLVSNTTESALKNLPDIELKNHIDTLDDLKQRAGRVLEYWLIQRDSANGDKEAFEEVIENLVKHAKKIRK